MAVASHSCRQQLDGTRGSGSGVHGVGKLHEADYCRLRVDSARCRAPLVKAASKTLPASASILEQMLCYGSVGYDAYTHILTHPPHPHPHAHAHMTPGVTAAACPTTLAC